MTIPMTWAPAWWRNRAEKLDRPIFVLGCRRSGTTILGRSIGMHRQVGYLNEPTEIWKAAFPQSDVYTETRIGRLVLNEKDWTKENADRLCQAFSGAVRAKERQRLCEKTPVNCFRGPLIHRIFPDALYIYIERDPLAVAESVAVRGSFSANDNPNNSKWERVVELAEQNPATRGFAGQCETVLQKVVLEWMLHTIFARQFLFEGPVPANRILRIRYEAFADDAAGTLAAVAAFAGLEHDIKALAWASQHVHPARRAQPHDDDPVIRMLLQAAASNPQSKPV